jgi:ABC-2 type transport system ATP-binding protein
MNADVIAADRLTRTYRARRAWIHHGREVIPAVKEVTFSVPKGELFGLLGPNGAGKTTLIKMLNTLLVPTSGTARICGFDVKKDTREVRRRIGYVFGGDRGLYERLSALDNLRYFAELYHVPYREQRKRIAEVLDLVNLSGREHQRVETYSRGMRQRLHIARGLLHRPEVLFMDEPSIGVDPVGARDLRATVANLATSGTTILLTTHYMAEAEELCGRIAVIAEGQIRALGTPSDLKKYAEGRRAVEIEASGVRPHDVEQLRQVPGVVEATVEELGSKQLLTVLTRSDVDAQPGVLASLAGIRLGRVVSREPTLEDAYVSIVSAAQAARPSYGQAPQRREAGV